MGRKCLRIEKKDGKYCVVIYDDFLEDREKNIARARHYHELRQKEKIISQYETDSFRDCIKFIEKELNDNKDGEVSND